MPAPRRFGGAVRTRSAPDPHTNANKLRVGRDRDHSCATLGAAFAALNPVTPLNTATFADPPQNDMPWARRNFPPAGATIDRLEADIQDAYDHDVAGLEIGQGGVPTTDRLVAIHNRANALGVTVSLKVAGGLPGTTYAQTDPYARRTLQASKTAVNAGESFNSAVTGTASGTIVAVEAVSSARACSGLPPLCSCSRRAPRGEIATPRRSASACTSPTPSASSSHAPPSTRLAGGQAPGAPVWRRSCSSTP
jgi:hypothetical protein